VVAKGQTV